MPGAQYQDPHRPPVLGTGLFDSIADDALDDGYYRHSQQPSTATRTGKIVIGLAIAALAAITTISAVQTVRDKPVAVAERDNLISDIKERKHQLSDRNTTAEELRSQIRSLRKSRGRPDPSTGAMALSAGGQPARGEGVLMTINDSAHGNRDGRVRDRDLQFAVNGLWHAGAEAIAINEQRIGSLTAIHEASGVITVNFRSIRPPYTLTVLGPASGLQEQFMSNVAGRYLLGRQQEAGVDFQLEMGDELTVPAVPSQRLQLHEAHSVQESGGSS